MDVMSHALAWTAGGGGRGTTPLRDARLVIFDPSALVNIVQGQ